MKDNEDNPMDHPSLDSPEKSNRGDEINLGGDDMQEDLMQSKNNSVEQSFRKGKQDLTGRQSLRRAQLRWIE
jgi:hypothetical protein